jgi:hypothetical protein
MVCGSGSNAFGLTAQMDPNAVKNAQPQTPNTAPNTTPNKTFQMDPNAIKNLQNPSLQKPIIPPGQVTPNPTIPGGAQLPKPKPFTPGGTIHPMPMPIHPPGGHGGPGFFVGPYPSGYYQPVTETVMVAPEQVEQYWVPPEYNTVPDASGNPQTVLVRDGYMAQRILPARYETITRLVWVSSGPGVGFGLGLKF